MSSVKQSLKSSKKKNRTAFPRRLQHPAISRIWMSLAMACAATPLWGVGLTFGGGSLKAIPVKPEASTGLEMIYVVYDAAGMTVSYNASSPSSRPRWYVYSNLGGGYAEEIGNVNYEGSISSISDFTTDCGYIIEDGDRRYCFWIVEYKPKRLSLKGISLAPEQDCSSTTLEMEGNGEPIHYFTINGQQKVLSREIEVEYSTLEWDGEGKNYRQVDNRATFEYLPSNLVIRPAPLCATDFTVSGDCFLKEWNWLQTLTSDTFQPHAVEVHTEAVQQSAGENEEGGAGSNLIKSDTASGLGGSAPAVIDFYAYASDGVRHHEWQMADNEDFENVEFRFNEQDLTYTFTEEGTVYVRYLGANSDGSCEAYGDVYTITIGASDLKCPNVFSPNGDGVNDEWKVAYRSLLDFECWIFDRYGNQITHFTDPTQGWDGRRGGKDPVSGVYYYVIKATGSDGKKYKLSGDINILINNSRGGGSATDEATPSE